MGEVHIPLHCYEKHIDELARKQGVAASLWYVRDVIYPAHGYSLVHFLLHHIGELAYQENPHIESLSTYLQPFTDVALREGEFMHGFDGLAHGYITAYIAASERPQPEMIKSICESEVVIPGVTTNTFTCYHTLGHALMFAHNNSLTKTLDICDTLADTARQGCYFGTFMENGFLYLDTYHPDAPRPDATGVSMKHVCEKFSGDHRRACEVFVGDSYLAGPSHDLAGAFEECGMVQEHYACAERVGSITIASLSKNMDDARALCSTYATNPVTHVYCVAGAERGLREGMGILQQSFFSEALDVLGALRASIRLILL
ncbi:MAG: hypothetical protein HYT30_01640 [Parcubacteria group bacterium]|nr:hypothetical protein [Parcubacteria group bacterium]